MRLEPDNFCFIQHRHCRRHLNDTKNLFSSVFFLSLANAKAPAVCVPFRTDKSILNVVSLTLRILGPLRPIAAAFLDLKRKFSATFGN